MDKNKLLKLLSLFKSKDIKLWNPNTSYCCYIEDHFRDILDYCKDNNTYSITYENWKKLLDTSGNKSKKGSETHNLVHALNVIDTSYDYHYQVDYKRVINVNKKIVDAYKKFASNKDFPKEVYNKIALNYIDFLEKNDIFTIDKASHVKWVAYNILITICIETKTFTFEEVLPFVRFVKYRNVVANMDKLKKIVYRDVNNGKRKFLSLLGLCEDGKLTKLGQRYLDSFDKYLVTYSKDIIDNNIEEEFLQEQALTSSYDTLERYNPIDPDDVKKWKEKHRYLTSNNKVRYKTNAKNKRKVLQDSKYECEYGNLLGEIHTTFPSFSNMPNYVEAHHLIPMSAQDEVNIILDDVINLVSLCPNCHKKIHFASDEVKMKMILKIYMERYNKNPEYFGRVNFAMIMAKYYGIQ